MRSPDTETACPMAIGTGGMVSKGVRAGTYPNFSISANDFAIAVVAARYRLPVPTARVVVELAGIGGAS